MKIDDGHDQNLNFKGSRVANGTNSLLSIDESHFTSLKQQLEASRKVNHHLPEKRDSSTSPIGISNN